MARRDRSTIEQSCLRDREAAATPFGTCRRSDKRQPLDVEGVVSANTFGRFKDIVPPSATPSLSSPTIYNFCAGWNSYQLLKRKCAAATVEQPRKKSSPGQALHTPSPM